MLNQDKVDVKRNLNMHYKQPESKFTSIKYTEKLKKIDERLTKARCLQNNRQQQEHVDHKKLTS